MLYWPNEHESALVDNESSPKAYVLDSFGLMAYLENEAATNQIVQIFTEAAEGRAHVYFSLINYGECLYIIEREQGLALAQEMIASVDQLPIEFVAADRVRIFAAAHLKAHYPISYADAFTVGLAQEFNASILTGDPEFRRVEEIVSILWLPQS